MSEFTQAMAAFLGDYPQLSIGAGVSSIIVSCIPVVRLLVKLHVSKDTQRSQNFAAMTAAEKRRK